MVIYTARMLYVARMLLKKKGCLMSKKVLMVFMLGATSPMLWAGVETYATTESLEARLSDSKLVFSVPTWLTYSGLTGTLAGGLNLTMGSGQKAATIDVGSATANLTLNGPFATASTGQFIKKGAGTLTLKPTNADAETAIRLGSGGGTENGDLAWDTMTGNATNSTYALNVAGGDLVLDGPYKFVTSGVKSGLTYTGEAEPRLILKNGAKLTASSTVVVAGGNSLAASPQQAHIVVDGDGSKFDYGSQRVWLSWYFGRTGGNKRGKPVLTAQDGGTICGTGDFVAGRSESDVTINALSGGTISCDKVTSARHYPFVSCDLRTEEWWNSGTSFTTVFNIDGAGSSFASVFGVYGTGVTVNASNGGLLKYNHVGMPWSTNAEPGAVSGVYNEKRPRRAVYNFDGGGLGCYSAGSSEWLTTVPFWNVGANGALFDVPARADAALDGTAKAVGTAGRIVKTGDGTLAMRPQPLDVEVQGGSVHFAVQNSGSKTKAAGTVTVPNGSDLHAAGSMALGGMTIPSSAPLHLRGKGFENVFRNWTYLNDLGGTYICSFTVWRPDGFIATGYPMWSDANTVGNAWYNEKVAVDKSFTLTFDFYWRQSANGRNPIGVSVIWQNSADGLAAHGGHGSYGSDGLGFGSGMYQSYSGTATTLTNNAFAAGFGINSGNICFGENGTMEGAMACIGWAQEYITNLPDNPYRMMVRYDADAHTMAATLYGHGGKGQSGAAPVWTATRAVDLAAVCGGPAAYFGFGALHWNAAQGELNIGNVHLAYDVAPPARQTLLVGGNVTVVGNATWNTKLAPDPDTVGFGFGSLAWTNGATLDISTEKNVAGASGSPGAPYLGFESATGSGLLVKRGDAFLALSEHTTNAIRAVRLEEGGLTLRKETLEPVRQKGRMASNWFTSKSDPTVGYHGGIRLGAASADGGNAEDVHLRRRVRIDRPWRMRCKVEHRKPVNTTLGESFAFFVHNHPNGPEKTGDHHGGLWTDDSHFFGVGFKNAYVVLMDGGLREPLWNANKEDDVHKRTRAEASGPSFHDIYTPSEVEVTCDPQSHDMTVVVSRSGETSTYSWTNVSNVDPVEKVGVCFAYPGFGCYQSGSRYLSEIYDFEFETVNPEDMWAGQSYLDTLAVAGSSVEVVADCSITNATFTLASSVAMAADASLALREADAPNKIALGTVSAADDGGTLTVDGTTLVLSSRDALPRVLDLVLLNGAKLELDFAGTLFVKSITVDGTVQPDVYSAANAQWIAGRGSIGHLVPGAVMIFR